MSCEEWRHLESQARTEATERRPTVEGWNRIGQAIEAAQAHLVGDDVRSHAISFDPGKWQPYAGALPEDALRTGCISRSDVFEMAAEPASDGANWRLFCSAYIWGQGTNGYGRARIERIIRTTPRS